MISERDGRRFQRSIMCKFFMLIRQVLNRIGEDADAGGDGFSGVELGQYLCIEREYFV